MFRQTKKWITSLILISLIFSFAFALPTLADAEINETSDQDAYAETMSSVNFVGMLIEIGSTNLPTSMIIRSNADGIDYTVEMDEFTVTAERKENWTSLSDWIPGDQIRVIGMKNENTGVVEAGLAENLSIKTNDHFGLNGWVDSIDHDKNVLDVQWAGAIHRIRLTQNSHLVVGLKNPADINDLQIGDRIRVRLLKRNGEIPEAKILIVLRRGKDLFMKVRTWATSVELVSMPDDLSLPVELTVKVLPSPKLREGDVNNLIGLPGEKKTLLVTDDTRVVRRFRGNTDLSEFIEGDQLVVVGRINDDGTISAKLIKNNSIWMTTSFGRLAQITNIDVNLNTLTVQPYWPLTAGQTTVKITADTNILVDGQANQSITKLQVGHNVRFRGYYSQNNKILTAITIVDTTSLP